MQFTSVNLGAGGDADDYGGEWGEAIQACIVDPFTKETGTKILPDPGVSSVTLGKLRQQKGSPVIDIARMDGGVSELAAADGLLEDITAAAVPNMVNILSEGVYKHDDGAFLTVSYCRRGPSSSSPWRARTRCHLTRPSRRGSSLATHAASRVGPGSAGAAGEPGGLARGVDEDVDQANASTAVAGGETLSERDGAHR